MAVARRLPLGMLAHAYTLSFIAGRALTAEYGSGSNYGSSGSSDYGSSSVRTIKGCRQACRQLGMGAGGAAALHLPRLLPGRLGSGSGVRLPYRQGGRRLGAPG